MERKDKSKPTTAKKSRKKSATGEKEADAQHVANLIAARADVLRMATEIATIHTTPSRWNAKAKAADLRVRMATFSGIYNAAWQVRHYQHGSPAQLAKSIDNFFASLAHEISSTNDREALLYAVADSLTLSPHGLPWQG